MTPTRLLAPVAVLLAAQIPTGHLASSGVAVAGGGFVTVTAVWVTPGLVDHPSYRALAPDEDRSWHREAARAFTLIRLEVENASDLTVEGYLALNLRLDVGGVLQPLVTGRAGLGPHGRLTPDLGRQVLPPRTAWTGLLAFPRITAPPGRVHLIVRPLWVFQRGRGQVGTLPEFVLRFDPGAMAYPPAVP